MVSKESPTLIGHATLHENLVVESWNLGLISLSTKAISSSPAYFSDFLSSPVTEIEDSFYREWALP